VLANSPQCNRRKLLGTGETVHACKSFAPAPPDVGVTQGKIARRKGEANPNQDTQTTILSTNTLRRQDGNTANGANLLLSLAREELGTDDHGLLWQTTLAKDLEVALKNRMRRILAKEKAKRKNTQ
jgi:hypothetical protein